MTKKIMPCSKRQVLESCISIGILECAFVCCDVTLYFREDLCILKRLNPLYFIASVLGQEPDVQW